MKKRQPQKNKALTNNQTPQRNLFNQEVASELVDEGGNKANKKKQ
ncbi:hypothetical protein [Halalkalibacter oceani]|nr:hypothetical protein [Halalkalibacter oceani]